MGGASGRAHKVGTEWHALKGLGKETSPIGRTMIADACGGDFSVETPPAGPVRVFPSSYSMGNL